MSALPSPELSREARKHPRVSLHVPVVVSTAEARVMAQTAEISAGGLLLRSAWLYRPGTRVALRLNLPDGGPIESQAQVVHEKVASNMMGLEFVDLSRESQSRLTDFTCKMIRHVRRGGRIARRYHLLVRGSSAGHRQEELAETRVISRHGGLFTCRCPFNLGEKVYIVWLDRAQHADVRIVWRRDCWTGGLIDFGFEFLEWQSFWEGDFPSRPAVERLD
ncbi:MAG: PilZ domain-containing protein [Terriglobales bacterium]